MKQKIILLLGLTLLTAQGYAARNPVTVQSQITFNAQDGQHWYILHNKSKQAIWLNAIIKNPGASAGWSSKVDSGQYSLLALNKKQLQFVCGVSAENQYQKIVCQKMMTVSNTQAKVTDPNANASYWVVENVPLAKLKSLAAQRGIQIK